MHTVKQATPTTGRKNKNKKKQNKNNTNHTKESINETVKCKAEPCKSAPRKL